MRFHISSIQVDLILDGWTKTVIVDDRDLLALQNLIVVGTGHKKVDLKLRVPFGKALYVLDLPVTLNCMRNDHVSMELPSKVIATTADHTVIAELKNPVYHLIDLTPNKRSANIIPVHNLALPEPVKE